ncbi:serine/threonine protein kinase [Streptomyces bobili]|uniref:serine/threonine-protein kinase n=1 Tax=Streptomyces bobili TaxID=67280 RepID=UPI002253D09D|nr:serine/threonine-protein kinase [Streptomyces bobili]MCX5525819.1 serine/threonine protein kinase [Streptomyces bobili]
MQPLGADEPTEVGPYRLLGRLGSGGMGRVYLGRSAGGRTVAVKIVHPHLALDEEFRARFRREVDAARRVGGAWTAPVLDSDPTADVPWVATAYAAGPSLAAAVAGGGALPEHTVRVLGAGLAEALDTVHGLGLVHRDVKPSNVLLTFDGPLLIDFGIARATDGTASLTSTGVSVGSPGYMAPEQILGKGASGAADVFSLGAVLAYAATGEPPFPGDSSAALLYKVVHEQPALGRLDGELLDLVTACLAKDPAARPTPAEIARRLAPEGAARLVASGWLPGRLVEQVGRSAVQLLNLEATGTGTGTDTGAGQSVSGPVGFSSASVGEFGPAPVMAAPVTPAPVAPAPVLPAPRDAGTTAAGGERPGKVSLSLAAAATPGEGGRGRRLSCTVALAVAGALAAVTVGSVFVLDLMPGSGSDDNDSAAGSDTASSNPAATAPPAPAGAVPAAYVGTWEGQGSGLGGQLPMGTFRLTVKQAVVGKELGRLRQTDVLGGVCLDVLTLTKVTSKELITTSVGAETNHGGCNPAAHTVRLTRTGDDLTYRSESSAEGNPVARMSRVD